jgi:hypothetical protein
MVSPVESHELSSGDLISVPLPSRLPRIDCGLLKDFQNFRDRERSLNERREWLEIARGEIAYFTERLFTQPSDYLEAIGATYNRVPGYSPLSGFPSRLPQDVLEDAFVRKFFYETLMTHKTLLTSYQGVESAGFVGVRGGRIPDGHPLLQKTTAYTFENFGFAPRVPLDDGVDESTTRCLASGGSLSWITHSFPSQVIMGSAMPDLWGDMGLAAGAKMAMLMLVGCDGDVGTPEKQLLRYQSAQELIRRDPGIHLHPDRDFVLPSGDKLHVFLERLAFRHLGAALKPGPGIAERYRPLIVDHGCKVVEVYDPGCTNLLERSVAELRDAYGDSIEILAGRIPPERDDEKLFRYLCRLGKHRVTFRCGLLDGKICKTFKVSGGAAPMNFQTSARIANMAEAVEAECGHPVIVSVESGASERLNTAIAAGIAGVSISGSLAGTTLEHSPPMYEFVGGESQYSGEASEVTKVKSGRVNAVGDPLQVEGVSGKVVRPRGAPLDSLGRRLQDYLVGVVKGNRFQRDDSVLAILADDPTIGSEIILFSPEAVAAAQVHIK